MTQVQMADGDLNLKLAELMGWKSGGDPNKKRDFVWWIDENRFRLPEKWNPCTDHTASLEVQAAAIAKDKHGYLNNLAGIITEVYPRDLNWDIVWTNDEIISFITATPRQRAEAAYMTLKEVQRHE
ncbi:hypothetical protein [Paenibacillus medicaginis]|uniref:Phage ABA sandwich domain-containing protein n=1 Tax=Paenibacillus medicaginis TaxID=1470560 RepID=A0ABV5C0R8_9BACL